MAAVSAAAAAAKSENLPAAKHVAKKWQPSASEKWQHVIEAAKSLSDGSVLGWIVRALYARLATCGAALPLYHATPRRRRRHCPTTAVLLRLRCGAIPFLPVIRELFARTCAYRLLLALLCLATPAFLRHTTFADYRFVLSFRCVVPAYCA
jgi:hypothetical protein